MRMRRVVVTGMGAISPYGKGCGLLFDMLRQGKSAIRRVDALEGIAGLGPRVAGTVPDVGLLNIPRKLRRSMSPMSCYAYLAAEEALAQARLQASVLEGGDLGVAIGSTLGSPEALEQFFSQYLASMSVEQMKSMMFFKVMGHSVAANIAQAFGVTGRVLAPSAACSSGCQAIGLAYECIASGKQNFMLCGGADEYHPLVSATFDIMTAASTAFNETPELTPRPFDKKRDGVVCSEGAGVLLLETLESAEKRDAPVLAEILGFASTSDAGSIASPDPDPVRQCMLLALRDAGVSPQDIAYINAHATGTEQGDIAESHAIEKVFGRATPVSSLKGHLGHTMAASGALETVASIEMLRHGVFLPTRNLEEPDERCAPVNLLKIPVEASGALIVKNSFALGGINCALVIRGSA